MRQSLGASRDTLSTEAGSSPRRLRGWRGAVAAGAIATIMLGSTIVPAFAHSVSDDLTYGYASYTVQPGETLGGIPDHYGLSSEDIAKVNGFDRTVTLQPGVVLAIPVGDFAPVMPARGPR